jgi:hypothetical protein
MSLIHSLKVRLLGNAFQCLLLSKYNIFLSYYQLRGTTAIQVGACNYHFIGSDVMVLYLYENSQFNI